MTIPFQIISATIKAVPQVVSLLKPETLDALKAAAGYDGIQAIFRAAVFDAVEGYMSGTGYAPGPRLAMSTALSRAYLDTLDLAYQDGGGELPIDEDTAGWARGVIDAQFGFIDELFDHMRQLRKDGNTDPTNYANARADGYASALDGFYAEAKMRGSKNIVLEFGGSDGKESCPTCKRLKGQRHKISWWIDKGLIPGQAGNENFECKGYNCEHILFNPKTGEEFTV